MVSRNVLFDENSSWPWKETVQEVEILEPAEDDVEGIETVQQPINSSSSTRPASRPIMNDDFYPDTPVRKVRTVQELYETTQVLFVADPTTYEEAAEKEEWRQAMQEELAAIEKNQTWQLIELPEGKHASARSFHLRYTLLLGLLHFRSTRCVDNGILDE